MYLEKISLHNFRNYSATSLEFGRGVQCLMGKNGSGKTNLLDAIYYLSFTKSSLNSTDTQNVKTGAPMFLIRGIFNKSAKPGEVVCSFEIGHKKVIRENSVDYLRLSEHIGKYPTVLIAPNDIELIWNGGEIRRKFFDSLISQINPVYLENLITYASHLKMRNAMLRQFSEKGKVDVDLLESCDHKLIPSGIYVANTRKAFVDAFTPVFQGHYGFLSKETAEAASIHYCTELDDFSLNELWQRNLQRDIRLQRTCAGIHRDDFIFSLNGFELKRYGSQGQQKSFLIGLKLAEFDTIAQKKGFKPILLLDDIFDKLDDDRIARLIDLVGAGGFGQLFLTDARPDRSRDLLTRAGIRPEMFLVENGNLTKS